MTKRMRRQHRGLNFMLIFAYEVEVRRMFICSFSSIFSNSGNGMMSLNEGRRGGRERKEERQGEGARRHNIRG